jgi:hypothetical protein
MEKKDRIQMDRKWDKYGYQEKTAPKVVQTDGGMYEAAKRNNEDLLNLEQPTCTTCNRCWPGLPMHTRHTCSDCAKDKSDPKRFSRENVMDPGPMPEGLPLDVSPVEEMLFARGVGFVSMCRLPHGATGYKGHVCHFPQNIELWHRSLPRGVLDLDIILLRREGANKTHKKFRVRRSVVRIWLQWLIANNPYYSDCYIDWESLNKLPEDSTVVHDLPHANVEKDPQKTSHDVGPTDTGTVLPEEFQKRNCAG